MNSLQPITPNLPAIRERPLRADAAAERSDMRRLLGVALRHIWLATGVAAAVFLLVVLVFAQMTPVYTASGSLLIDKRRENLAQAQQGPQSLLPPDTSAIDTEVEVVRSRALAESVVRKLKLYQDPEFNTKLRRGWFGPAPTPPATPDASTLARVTDVFQNHFQARRAGLTYVIQVSASSTSPEKAATLVNTLISSYLERQLQTKLSAVARANKELGANVEQLRGQAEVAEARVQEYKNANNLFSAQGATMAEQEVSTLNQQIAAAKADRAEKEARLNAALAQVRRGSGGADIGAALGSDTIRELRSQEAATSIRLAQLKADFKADYPEVKRTQAQLNDIRGQVQLEINRILSSLRADAQAAAQREASLLGSRGQAQGGLAANNQAQVGLVGLQQRADAARQIYDGYLNRAKQVAVEGSLQQSDATVNSAAAAPVRPSSPNKKLGAAVAALLAMLAAGVSVLVAELWNRGVRSRDDVERTLGVPFAGVLPELASVTPFKLKRQDGAAPDYLVAHPFSGFAEAFRNLRAFLLLADRSGLAKLVAITSAVPREGKSTTSLCLARTLALSGARVAIVDCDLRQRGLTKLVDGPKVGLIEVATKGVPLNEAMVVDEKSGLWILSAGGGQGPLPHDLFSRPETDDVLRELVAHFDHVILDTPPILGVADARIIAAKADRTLYIVQWNKTPMRAAQSAVDILRECGANLSGAVLSKVNVKQQARYGYGDSSDYFHYYRDYYLAAS
ncbi:MAG: pssP [Caulobacter sp.]|nr:pssP [Caulobacter sp.]